MCGRTAISLSKLALQKACAYKASNDAKDNKDANIDCGMTDEVIPEWITIHPKMEYQPGYNHAPGSILPILVSSALHDPTAEGDKKRTIVPMAWGLIPSWFKKDKKEFHMKTSNARSESLISGETKFYRDCLVKGRRGLLLVEGYFEWTRDRQPHFFYLPQDSSIDFKNRKVWSELSFTDDFGDWQGPRLMTIPVVFDVNYHVTRDTFPYYSFSVITTEAHDELQWIHERMPAILDNDDDRDKWLNFQEVSFEKSLDLLREPYARKLDYHVVTDSVNNARYQSVNCVLAADPLKQQEKKNSKQPTIESFFRRVPKPKPNEGKSSQEPTPLKLRKVEQ